ncbi:hypothetical protein MOUN0_J06898 [Monosporozyma unispora]|nr:hypothetical protein C6P44_005353 [Kazachstania unispora]
MTRITNRCRRIKYKIVRRKAEEEDHRDDVHSTIDLRSPRSAFMDESQISQEQVGSIIDLINNSSSIRMSRFDSKDRIFDSKGVFVSKTYSCPPRNFDITDNEQGHYNTVIRTRIPSEIEENSSLSTENKENFCPKNQKYRREIMPQMTRSNISINRRARGTHTTSKNKRVTKPTATRKYSSTNQIRKVTPPPPPSETIPCFTNLKVQLNDYDKGCEERNKAAGLPSFAIPLGEQDDTFF